MTLILAPQVKNSTTHLTLFYKLKKGQMQKNLGDDCEIFVTF